jgi:hypothetical protein
MLEYVHETQVMNRAIEEFAQRVIESAIRTGAGVRGQGRDQVDAGFLSA